MGALSAATARHSTLGEPPVPLGTFRYEGGDPFSVRRRMAAFTPFTYVANVTGQPAMSVPTYWTAGGLPSVPSGSAGSATRPP